MNLAMRPQDGLHTTTDCSVSANDLVLTELSNVYHKLPASRVHYNERVFKEDG